MHNNNKILKYFQSQKIDHVLFDMDGTLIDTDTYYGRKTEKVLKIVLNILYGNPSEEKTEEIIKEIRKIMMQEYSERGKPGLINEQTEKGLKRYLEKHSTDRKGGIDTDEIINNLYYDFYSTSPAVFSATLDILHILKENNIPKGVYSHAQHDWTEIKINKIKKLYTQKYNKNLSLPFFTTDIKDNKNPKGWEMAAKHLDFELRNTLVVGDNLYSDILPAIQAGCKNLVHISEKVASIEYEIPKEVSLHTVQNIENLFNVF